MYSNNALKHREVLLKSLDEKTHYKMARHEQEYCIAPRAKSSAYITHSYLILMT